MKKFVKNILIYASLVFLLPVAFVASLLGKIFPSRLSEEDFNKMLDIVLSTSGDEFDRVVDELCCVPLKDPELEEKRKTFSEIVDKEFGTAKRSADLSPAIIKKIIELRTA